MMVVYHVQCDMTKLYDMTEQLLKTCESRQLAFNNGPGTLVVLFYQKSVVGP